MYVIQRQDGQMVGRLHFASGPIYIGRGTDCQVLLGNAAVSRQHAVIYATDSTGWWIRDLCSANGTDLNGRPVERAKLKSGDSIVIGDSTLEVDLSDDTESTKPSHLEDTLVGMPSGPRVIARPLEFDHAPPIRMPAQRVGDFIQALSLLGKASGPNEMVQTVLQILAKHFTAARVWCGLRYDPAGALTNYSGITDAGEPFHLHRHVLKDKVRHALEERAFLLITGVKDRNSEGAARAAMIAPLVGSAGNYGIFYLDSHPGREPYQAGDLDYLMLVALHLGAVLENY